MVITRGTTVTKTRSQCPTICDDTGLNSFTVLLFSSLLLLSQWLVHIQHPWQKSRATVQVARADQQVNQQLNLCSTGVSFKMRQLKAKGGKKATGLPLQLWSTCGKAITCPLCNSLHKQFEENSLLDCYHYASLGQKCQYKESWPSPPTGNIPSRLLLLANISRGQQMRKEV